MGVAQVVRASDCGSDDRGSTPLSHSKARGKATARVKVLTPPLSPPENPIGYTDGELKRYMTAEEWIKFSKWMGGQTQGVSLYGESLTYCEDAERGIALIRYGIPTYFD